MTDFGKKCVFDVSFAQKSSNQGHVDQGHVEGGGRSTGMLDVDALKRLRQEVHCRNCTWQRLLTWYKPVGQSRGGMGMFTFRRNWEAERNEKWFMTHSEQRRREIIARRDEIVKMALNCYILDQMLLVRIQERQAFLVLEQNLVGLLCEDVIPVIWQQGAGEGWFVVNMTSNLPKFSVTPPCNYEYQPRRWRVRMKWLDLIIFKSVHDAKKREATIQEQSEIFRHLDAVFEDEVFSSLSWVKTYEPMRLA